MAPRARNDHAMRARKPERRAVLAAAMLVCAWLIAGCDASHHPPGAASHTHGPARDAAARCARPAQLGAGVAVANWRLGAVYFLSPQEGVALTASSIPCDVPETGGHEVEFQRQPVRLALTEDGGRDWLTEGSPLSVAPVSWGEQLVASSTQDVWAIAGHGQLLATTTAGGSWTSQPVPRPAVQLALSHQTLWALACPFVQTRCRPALERLTLPRGGWTRLAMPRPLISPNPELAAPSDRIVAIEVAPIDRWAGELLTSSDGGRHWEERADPKWDRQACGPGGLTIASNSDWWLLCIGNGAAGSSTKAVVRTTDGGQSWHTMSAVTTLAGRQRAGSLPASEAGPLTAGSPTRLWLALTNGLAESSDAGKTWSIVPNVNLGGATADSFDVLSTTEAWLLAPGVGLWQTTNGRTWFASSRIGAPNAAPQPCRHLILTVHTRQGIMQDAGIGVGLRGKSPSMCTLTGRPAAQALLSSTDRWVWIPHDRNTSYLPPGAGRVTVSRRKGAIVQIYIPDECGAGVNHGPPYYSSLSLQIAGAAYKINGLRLPASCGAIFISPYYQ